VVDLRRRAIEVGAVNVAIFSAHPVTDGVGFLQGCGTALGMTTWSWARRLVQLITGGVVVEHAWLLAVLVVAINVALYGGGAVSVYMLVRRMGSRTAVVALVGWIIVYVSLLLWFGRVPSGECA
jgi:hypothetical protein